METVPRPQQTSITFSGLPCVHVSNFTIMVATQHVARHALPNPVLAFSSIIDTSMMYCLQLTVQLEA